MYAVELSFAVDGRRGVPPSVETVAASIRRHGVGDRARVEHFRARRSADALVVVVFIAAAGPADARALASAIGRRVATELRHLRFTE